MNRTAKTVPEATTAPNETLTLHFEGDLAVVHPHACHESCELQGKERRFAIGRTEGSTSSLAAHSACSNRSWGSPTGGGPIWDRNRLPSRPVPRSAR